MLEWTCFNIILKYILIRDVVAKVYKDEIWDVEKKTEDLIFNRSLSRVISRLHQDNYNKIDIFMMEQTFCNLAPSGEVISIQLKCDT